MGPAATPTEDDGTSLHLACIPNTSAYDANVTLLVRRHFFGAICFALRGAMRRPIKDRRRLIKNPLKPAAALIVPGEISPRRARACIIGPVDRGAIQRGGRQLFSLSSPATHGGRGERAAGCHESTTDVRR